MEQVDASTVHIMKSSEPSDRSDHLGNSMSKLEMDSYSKAYTQLSMLNHVVIIVISLLINHQCCRIGTRTWDTMGQNWPFNAAIVKNGGHFQSTTAHDPLQ